MGYNRVMPRIISGTLRAAGTVWGVLGVALLLASAIWRLVPHVLDGFTAEFSLIESLVLAVWCVVMLVGEGYRGFQKQFAPRVAARALQLYTNGSRFDLLFAPLYCMSYYSAPRRRVISSWAVTVGVIVLINIVVHIAQPWRGIIDAGVVLGLAYGLACVFVSLRRTFRPPAVPENSPES